MYYATRQRNYGTLTTINLSYPIVPPLHHETRVESAAFSANGLFEKLLITGCYDSTTYTVSPLYSERLSSTIFRH